MVWNWCDTTDKQWLSLNVSIYSNSCQQYVKVDIVDLKTDKCNTSVMFRIYLFMLSLKKKNLWMASVVEPVCQKPKSLHPKIKITSPYRNVSDLTLHLLCLTYFACNDWNKLNLLIKSLVRKFLSADDLINQIISAAPVLLQAVRLGLGCVPLE